MPEYWDLIAGLTSLIVLVLFLRIRRNMKTVPHFELLIFALGFFTASLFCSAADVLIGFTWFNLAQHVFAPASCVMLASWSWLTFVRDDGVAA